MTKFSLKSLLWTLFFATLIPFSGCINDNEPAPEPEPYALIALYNAIPDSPELDVYVDNAKANNIPFKYNQYFKYSPIATGVHQFRFKSPTASDTLVSTLQNFVASKFYSLFTTGTAADPQILMMEDVLATSPAVGKAFIRVINLSPDTPPIRVEIENREQPLVSSQYFRQASSFIEVDAKTSKFILKTADEQLTLSTSENVNIVSQNIYTLVIKGFSNPPEGNTNKISMTFLQ